MMSEHLKLARLKIEAACKMKPTDEHAVKLEEMLYCLLLHLEAQQETQASVETTSSSRDTGPTADDTSGSSTSSETYFLARAGTDGVLEIMAMATLHAPSSRRTLGSALNDLRDHYWTPMNPVILASRWRSGATRLIIPAPDQDGPSVGGEAMSREDAELCAACGYEEGQR